jgi:hypothetical protein
MLLAMWEKRCVRLVKTPDRSMGSGGETAAEVPDGPCVFYEA